MPLIELEKVLNTNLELGLSRDEANTRLLRDGPNSFTPPKQTSIWIIFLKELTSGFALIMWLSALISISVYFMETVKNPQDVRNYYNFLEFCLYFNSPHLKVLHRNCVSICYYSNSIIFRYSTKKESRYYKIF